MPNNNPICSLTFAFIAGFFCTVAHAHPFPEPQLQQINQRLAQAPRDPMLYLRRAEIHVMLEHFGQALDDLDLASTMGLQSAQLPLARGYVYLQQGNHDLAIAYLSRALELEPDLPRALKLRAEAYQLSLEPGLSLRDWQRLISISKRPSPTLFLKAAQAAGEARDDSAKLSIIDQGLSQWPQESSLLQMGVDTLWQQQEYDAAIQRLEAHAASAIARPYFWKLQLADKLLLLGREADARVALESADYWLQLQPSLNRGQLEIQRDVRQRMAALAPPDR